jgi:hypothetical protein
MALLLPWVNNRWTRNPISIQDHYSEIDPILWQMCEMAALRRTDASDPNRVTDQPSCQSWCFQKAFLQRVDMNKD